MVAALLWGGMQDAVDADWRRTLHAIQDVLGAKWTLHVLHALDREPAGFNELKRRLDGVTAKVLSERLHELRCLGFVTREVHATVPPSTTYRLTDAGEQLAGTLGELESMVDVVECVDGDCAMPVEGSEHCTDGGATCACDC